MYDFILVCNRWIIQNWSDTDLTPEALPAEQILKLIDRNAKYPSPSRFLNRATTLTYVVSPTNSISQLKMCRFTRYDIFYRRIIVFSFSCASYCLWNRKVKIEDVVGATISYIFHNVWFAMLFLSINILKIFINNSLLIVVFWNLSLVYVKTVSCFMS